MSYLRALYRTVAFGALALTLMPLQVFVVAPLFGDHLTLQRTFFKNVRRIMGIKAEFNGVATDDTNTIYVANHMSYIDMFLMGGFFKGAFVGKNAFAKLPFAKTMAKSANLIFIWRNPAYISRAHEKMINVLNQDENIILFPEAKITHGPCPVMFRAGLFSILFTKVARGEENNPHAVKLTKDVKVRPVAIKVTHVAGQDVAINPGLRESYVWGDKSLVSHFWEFAKLKDIRVEVTALPALDPKDFDSHKDLINKAHDMVSDAIMCPSRS